MAQGRRDFADKRTVREPEGFEFSEIGNGGWDGTGGEGVVRKIELAKRSEVAKEGGDATIEKVRSEGEDFECWKESERRRNGAGEVVSGEVEVAEQRKRWEDRRDWPD
ncbi:hypothetical protein HPP92_023839 [Vanilla planifolia]|uniref:Uncharacterized protein n=1 Tax=Vanilla planifolia TaxID=51239 RepID=A0A835PN31_VANPL|nr:hypothetical protein HPP92_023839 [Vanilla planifolia]